MGQDTFHFEDGTRIQWTGRDGKDLTATIGEARKSGKKNLSSKAAKRLKKNAAKMKRTTPPDAYTQQKLAEQSLKQVSQMQKAQVVNATTGEPIKLGNETARQPANHISIRQDFETTRQNFAQAVLWRMAIKSPYFPKVPCELKDEIGNQSPFEWVSRFPSWIKIYDYFSSKQSKGNYTTPPPCKIRIEKEPRLTINDINIGRLSKEKKSALKGFKSKISRALVFKDKKPPQVPPILRNEFKGVNIPRWFRECPDFNERIEFQVEKLKNELLGERYNAYFGHWKN